LRITVKTILVTNLKQLGASSKKLIDNAHSIQVT
jgi:hypothetical protein